MQSFIGKLLGATDLLEATSKIPINVKNKFSNLAGQLASMWSKVFTLSPLANFMNSTVAAV